MLYAPAPGELLQSWVGLLLAMNVLDIISLAILTFGGWKVYRGRPLRVLTRSRRRFLEPLGVSKEAIQERVALLARGSNPTPAEELSWLSSETARGVDSAVTFAQPRERGAIAEAYEAYAALLETGALLGANHSPLVLSEAQRARTVSLLARGYARLSSSAADDPSNVIARELRLEIPRRGLTLTMHGAGKDGQGALHAHDLLVSYRDSRYFVRRSTRRGSHDVRLPVSAQEERELEKYFARPHRFDGALPRLVGWAADSDLPSGRLTLHLSIAQTTFAAVVADHYPFELCADAATSGHGAGVREVDGARVRVLTLSAVLVTRCGHLVFVKRSKMSGSHQGKLGPAANGNLEFDARPGLASDYGPEGLPDLRRALAREMREEIGVDVDSEDFVITGLGQFDAPTERGTFVLLGVCFVDLDRDAVLQAMQRADPIEGHWENEQTLVTLRVPRTDEERGIAIDWLVNDERLTPHATMAGLGALVVALRTDSFLVDIGAAVKTHALDFSQIPGVGQIVAECHMGGSWHPLPAP